MIIFNNWQITAQRSVIARQYDNLSRRLEVVGNLPEGYAWSILVQVGEDMDVITLESMEGGAGVTLTADQLSQSGYYQMQLRGTQGDVVRHTNVISVFIPASLSGDGQWPTLPSEFTQAEQRIRELNEHPPVPGNNGCWLVWDPEADKYLESEFKVQEILPSCASPYQQLVTDGEGNAKWEDRLAYETDPIITEVFPEQTLTDGSYIGSAYMFSVSDFTIMPNLEYTAVFDGVEYKCRSAKFGDIDYIGNVKIAGGQGIDTGEPFFIAPLSGMMVLATTDGPHTISLSMRNVVYHQLPLDYIENGKFLNGIIEHSSVTMTIDEESKYASIIAGSPIPMLIWGDHQIKFIETRSSSGVNTIYFEDYDGKSYTIKENSDGLFSIDDVEASVMYLGINVGGNSTSRIRLNVGEPVSIQGNKRTSGDALDYPTFCVKRTGSRNGQDFEVLGNGTVKAYSVILPSSTEGSTKKFKITVDDSGTIAATEVT